MSKRMSKREYWPENEKQPELKRPELKPCPFCGSKANLTEMRGVSLEGSLFMVECSNCSAIIGRHRETYQASKGYLHFYNKEDAIEAWNTRREEPWQYEETQKTGCGAKMDEEQLGNV